MEVKEDSFFVVNLNDGSDFTEAITSLGTKYCQDSVLIIPQGGNGAYLYGTNNTDFPGIDSTIEVGDFFGGTEAEFMTRVRGRPIVFKEGNALTSFLSSSSFIIHPNRKSVLLVPYKYAPFPPCGIINTES